MVGRLRRSILGKDWTQLGFFDSLQRWLATMVNLKISRRWSWSIAVTEEEEEGVVVAQYRRDGSFKQLEMMVALKSEGGCKLARSSTIVAVAVAVAETDERKNNVLMNKRITQVKSILTQIQAL